MTPEQAIARARQVWTEIEEIRRRERHGYGSIKQSEAWADLQGELKRLREIPGVSEGLEAEPRG